MSKVECLQGKTGSYRGCNQMEIIENKVNQGQVVIDSAKKLSNIYCPSPDKYQPQTHLLKVGHRFCMGQLKGSRLSTSR